MKKAKSPNSSIDEKEETDKNKYMSYCNFRKVVL